MVHRKVEVQVVKILRQLKRCAWGAQLQSMGLAAKEAIQQVWEVLEVAESRLVTTGPTGPCGSISLSLFAVLFGLWMCSGSP